MTAFEARLRCEGLQRYHHEHPFHVLMHEGRLTAHQLQQWVVNRYYYQTRIPIKDALILSKSEDPEFRRMWARRVHEQKGDGQNAGGLALWRRLAQAVGISGNTLDDMPSHALPGVRFACDAYVSLVREATLVEAVAASLTELFAPALMSARIAVQLQAGIGSLPRGQKQAATALGLTTVQTYRYVLLPMAFRIILPPLTSEFINTLKNTSVAITIGLLELTGQARSMEEFSFQVFEAFTAATVLYLLINLVIVIVMRLLERAVAIPGYISGK